MDNLKIYKLEQHNFERLSNRQIEFLKPKEFIFSKLGVEQNTIDLKKEHDAFACAILKKEGVSLCKSEEMNLEQMAAALRMQFDDSDKKVRDRALKAYLKISEFFDPGLAGREARALREDGYLDHCDPDVRARSQKAYLANVKKLEGLGTGTEATYLQKLISDKDPEVQKFALQALAILAPQLKYNPQLAADLAEEILKVLKNENVDPKLKVEAIKTLEELTKIPWEKKPTHAQSLAQMRAFDLAYRSGRKVNIPDPTEQLIKEAKETLTTLATDDKNSALKAEAERAQAFLGLWQPQAGGEGNFATRAESCLQLMEHPDPEVRLIALAAYEKVKAKYFGSYNEPGNQDKSKIDFKKVAVSLRTLFSDRDPRIRQAAVAAYGVIHNCYLDTQPLKLSEEEVRLGSQALRELIKDEDPKTVALALKAYDRLIPDLPEANRNYEMKELLGMMEDKNPRVREAAVKAYQSFITLPNTSHMTSGELTASANALQILRHDKDPGVQEAAIRASAELALRHAVKKHGDQLPHEELVKIVQDLRKFIVADRPESESFNLKDRQISLYYPELFSKLLPEEQKNEINGLVKDIGNAKINKEARINSLSILTRVFSSLTKEDMQQLAPMVRKLFPDTEAILFYEKLVKSGNLSIEEVGMGGEALAKIASTSKKDPLQISPRDVAKSDAFDASQNFLTDKFSDPDAKVRADALEAYSNIAGFLSDYEANRVFPQLMKLAKDPDPEVKQRAMTNLALIASKISDSNVPQLIQLFDNRIMDENREIRESALSGLGDLASKMDAKQVDDVTKNIRLFLFKNEDPATRAAAALAYGKLVLRLSPAEAEQGMDFLLKLTKDPDPIVRKNAYEALGQLSQAPRLDTQLATNKRMEQLESLKKASQMEKDPAAKKAAKKAYHQWSTQLVYSAAVEIWDSMMPW